MYLKIDIREKKLIPLLEHYNEEYDINLKIKKESLDIGDIICYNDMDEEKLVIERKTLTDLASSIRDGRYKEQSTRLNSISLHNHNIIYIIEGRMTKYNSSFTKVKPKALYSAMCSLQYFKGFSLIKTDDMNETAKQILFMVDKIKREKDKNGFYQTQKTNKRENTNIHKTNETDNSQEEEDNVQQLINYTTNLKRVKKENLTPENISYVILSQIPGISTTTSNAILSKFGSLYELMFCLKANPTCLDRITYKTKTGQERRINSKSIKSIKDYLLYCKSSNIEINTDNV